MSEVLVDVFQKELVVRGLITQDLANRSTHGAAPNSDLPVIQEEFNQAYAGHEVEFKTALLTARDYLGHLLARTWGTLNPNFLSYDKIGLAVMNADESLTGGAHQKNIRECFAWREITVPNPTFMLRRLSDCGLAGGMLNRPGAYRDVAAPSYPVNRPAFMEGHGTPPARRIVNG